MNKDWSDFNPSPKSKKYFSVPELAELLKNVFPRVDIYGAFTAAPRNFLDYVISCLKRIAVFLRVVPKTMSGKTLLKRIFFGRLYLIPGEITENFAPYVPAKIINANAISREYKIIYAVAYKI